ncbi:hypothetical protein HOLleu_13881 [Holothuria leucospilota]|uniref:Uncharacterized protein n=1 Tax=Holothuria leucospilota TaxID=206669 RepID=A0A9Q1C7C8_HOLLE|nr:hypothetical protein HOLleu_13881 [Holothuria leucospilota]
MELLNIFCYLPGAGVSVITTAELPGWDLFYSASLERDHCQVVSVKSKFVPWGRCYSFGEQNSFGSIVWFSPLALRQRVRGLLEKKKNLAQEYP